MGSTYKKIVLGLLKKMDAGMLELQLPGNEKMTIGKNESVKASIKINNDAFFKKTVLHGDIGFGEAFVDGDWDTDNITNVISWLIHNIENNPAMSGGTKRFSPVNLLNLINRVTHLTRNNSVSGSKKNIHEHYDLNNDFFSTFLDPSMTYSCGYFKQNENTLQEAQANKYDRLCESVKLNSNDHVLEIGCGWGGFAVHAAKKYGCKVTGITISKEQYDYAIQRIKKEGLENRVNIVLEDYRKIKGSFDKIISIEMLEAVGHKYLNAYFKKCHEVLKKDGVLGLQVIISPDSRYNALKNSVDWIQKHIFPGSLLPSVAAMNKAINDTGDMTLFSLNEMGLNYARTLATWRENFNNKIIEVKKLGFDDPFIRKWNYYLSYCEAAFAARNINVVQLVYSRPNNSKI